MTLRVFATAHQVATALASRIRDAVRATPDLVLALPTGRSPVPLYRRLVALHASGEIDFSRVTTFNLDEFLGIPASHPGSYRSFMQRHLFDHVNIPPHAIHFLDAAAPDPEAECARYDEAIDRAGGIGLQILGIGTNGHIGFNEPGRDLVAPSHRVTLRPETRRANVPQFGHDLARVPTQALSMGMGAILQARQIALIATGRNKAGCVGRLVKGSVTTRLPASFLQLHPQVDLYLDRAAAEKLRDD